MGTPDRGIARAKGFVTPLSLPFALRYLLATRPEVVTQVLDIVYRAISGHLIRQAGLTRGSAVTGAANAVEATVDQLIGPRAPPAAEQEKAVVFIALQGRRRMME